ncbi:MAG: NAD-dependent epimerase/dehydratase family protein, partial [Actinomycetota bacterium]
MALHLIVGAGPVGTAAADHLLRLGHEVRVVTRSGSGPDQPGIERIAADATDTDRLATLATGAAAIYNCANPKYHRWSTDWPPMATAMLDAAERAGARLVTMGNLYGYAAGASPMAAGDPLDAPTAKGAIRVDMWREALARHEAGRVRVTEVRASDFVGAQVGDNAHLGDRFVAAVLRGRSPRIIGPADVPHSWTFVDDVGRTLATLGADDRSLGRAWHVPTAPARTAQEMADAIAAAAGVDPVRVKR